MNIKLIEGMVDFYHTNKLKILSSILVFVIPTMLVGLSKPLFSESDQTTVLNGKEVSRTQFVNDYHLSFGAIVDQNSNTFSGFFVVKNNLPDQPDCKIASANHSISYNNKPENDPNPAFQLGAANFIIPGSNMRIDDPDSIAINQYETNGAYLAQEPPQNADDVVEDIAQVIIPQSVCDNLKSLGVTPLDFADYQAGYDVTILGFGLTVVDGNTRRMPFQTDMQPSNVYWTTEGDLVLEYSGQDINIQNAMPGDSGTYVLQKIDGKYKIVGLVSKSSKDGNCKTNPTNCVTHTIVYPSSKIIPYIDGQRLIYYRDIQNYPKNSATPTDIPNNPTSTQISNNPTATPTPTLSSTPVPQNPDATLTEVTSFCDDNENPSPTPTKIPGYDPQTCLVLTVQAMTREANEPSNTPTLTGTPTQTNTPPVLTSTWTPVPSSTLTPNYNATLIAVQTESAKTTATAEAVATFVADPNTREIYLPIIVRSGLTEIALSVTMAGLMLISFFRNRFGKSKK